MVAAPEYSIETQAKIIPALAALHNFINEHDPDDMDMDLAPHAQEHPVWHPSREPSENTVNTVPSDISEEERDRAVARRDRIARNMWNDYQAYIRDDTEDSNGSDWR